MKAWILSLILIASTLSFANSDSTPSSIPGPILKICNGSRDKACIAAAYQCVAGKLEAYNSDIYFDITSEEIEKILKEDQTGRYSTVVDKARECEAEAKHM